MTSIRRILLILALLALTTAALAQETFQLDPTKSSVEFTLGDVLHTVHGTFRMKASTIRFDPVTGVATGAFVVDATTGDSGNHSRDKKMHKDILESNKYPEIRFTIQTVRGNIPTSGSSQVELVGILSLHGADHPLTVTSPVQVDNGFARADVRFEVPYVAWGMKDPSTFILRVDKKVDIVVHAAGIITR
jgi:polyisoprenoid-binding protein YceI